MFSKRNATITLGIIIAILPFLGFPGSIRNVALSVLGILVALIAFSSRDKKEAIFPSPDVSSSGGVSQRPRAHRPPRKKEMQSTASAAAPLAPFSENAGNENAVGGGSASADLMNR